LTTVGVIPVVVRVRNSKMASILVAVTVAMTDKGCFPMVMEVCVGDGHIVRSMSDIAEAIVVVFVSVAVRAEFAVVDLDVC